MRVAMIFPPMPRRPALLLLAAALLVSACGSRTGDGNQPSAAFDPARFVASAPALDAPQIASDGEVVDAMLALTQRYQELDGTLGADGRVGQGWVTGHRVHFVADVDGRAHVFEGRFDGQRLVSTRAEAPWQAVRAS
jgi:hypothetical protein